MNLNASRGQSFGMKLTGHPVFTSQRVPLSRASDRLFLSVEPSVDLSSRAFFPFFFSFSFLPPPTPSIPFVIVYRTHDALCQKGSKGGRRFDANIPLPPPMKTETQWKPTVAIFLARHPFAHANSDTRPPRRRIGVVEKYFSIAEIAFYSSSTFANRAYVCVYVYLDPSWMTNRNCDSERRALLKETNIHDFPWHAFVLAKRINEAKFSTGR